MPRKKTAPEKRLIGKSDKIDLPELGLSNVRSKVDTGAYTSSLHCLNYYVRGRGGSRRLRFTIADPNNPEESEQEFVFKQFSKKRVRSSNGITEERYIISTPIILFGETIDTEFSLTFRGEMKYPILLGRKLLQGKFIVDVSRSNLSFREKSKKTRTKKKKEPQK